MYSKAVIIITLVLGLAYQTVVSAQAYYEMTPKMEEAYTSAMSLRKQDALQQIKAIKQSDPNNLLILHVENYLDFFEIFINENEAVFEKLEKNKDKRLDALDEADVKSPYTRFIKAEITLQWALTRLKFGQRFNALREVYSAYSLLEKNVKQYPDFILNKKSLSILHAISESIPGAARYLFGVKGSIEQGTEEIHELSLLSQAESSVFYDEITTIYANILYSQNNKKQESWELIESRGMDTGHNPLACFVVSNMAQKNGHNDYAIEILENRPTGDVYEEFHYLDLLLGKAKLYKLEADADVYIKKYIDNFQGEHFIKEAYQKLGWYELVMNNDFAAYKQYMRLCLDNGNDFVDEDDQAKKEAKGNKAPNPDLLTARLLYDGGYFQRAYTHLITRAYLFEEDDPNYLEYNYRMGRISQSLNNLTDAVQYYGYVINIGSDSRSYFVCNAALQIGLIFESQKEYDRAYHYLEKCLDMNPDQYKRGLHQKANSAKERIKEKRQKS